MNVNSGVLNAAGHDCRVAVRSLAATPWYSGLIVIILALAAGINTGLYGVIYSALFRPLAVSEPERLMYIYFNWEGNSLPYVPVTKDTFQSFAAQSTLFDDVAAHLQVFARMAGPRGSQVVRTEAVTTNYFDLLGVKSSLGRTFVPGDDDASLTEPAVVISHALWTTVFESDPNVLGRTFQITGYQTSTTVTVVGIAPSGFSGISNPWTPTQMWISYSGYPGTNQRGLAGFAPIARLREGVSPRAAAEAVTSIGAQLDDNMPKNERTRYVAFPATSVRTPFDPSMMVVPRRVLIGLVVVALTVLLIATVNVTGILMSRGLTRVRDLATRTALGASPWRLARQLLIESLVLALPASAASVIIGWIFLVVIRTQAPQRYSLDLQIEPGTIVAAVVVTTLLAVLITIMPVLAAWRLNLRDALGASGEVSSRNVRSRLRHVVVVPQIALTFVLLVLAAMHARALLHVYFADVGYGLRNVVAISMERRPPNDSTQKEDPRDAEKRTQQYYQRLLREFDSIPGADAVALTSALPLTSPGEGHHLAAIAGTDSQGVPAIQAAVSPQYFRAMGVPLIAGRTFHETDDLSHHGVAIVSRSVAAQLCPGRDCIGETLTLTNRFPARDEKPRVLHIVGVVGDTRPILKDQTVSRHVYGHLGQESLIVARTAVARMGRTPAVAIQAIREAVTAADPLMEVTQTSTLQQLVNDMLYLSRMAAGILGAAALIGLFFATVGLYAVLSYSVSQRTMEIGIRSAMGANDRDILQLIMMEGTRILLLGAAAGLVLARSTLPVVGRFIEMPRGDLTSWVAVGLVLSAIVLLACYLPARRAARLDALAAIRGR
jgi:predicted permease